jgi:hypothetical protein
MSPLLVGAVVAALVAPGPRVVTERDSGKTILLHRGASASLRLGHGSIWREPHVSSGAVELTQVYYFRDPGFTEWTVDAVARGRAVVTVTRASGARVRIVFRVVVT